jgi:hypothetical protein
MPAETPKPHFSSGKWARMIDTISRSKEANPFGNHSLPAITDFGVLCLGDHQVRYEMEEIQDRAARKRSEKGSR